MRRSDTARTIAFVLLAVVSAYGLYQLLTGDWPTVVADWRGKGTLLAGVMALGVLDVALGGLAWGWIYQRLGIRVWDASGLKVFLAGYAGILLPMKLGNLIRPDLFMRLGRAPLADCIKAEAIFFFLDATASLLILAGLGGYMVDPALGPVGCVITAGVVLGLADRVAGAMSGARLALPARFWLRWQTFGILALKVACWLTTGVALYLLVAKLPGNVGLIETLFFVPASSILGTGTGLPGGIGAIEAFLGISLKVMDIPAVHFAFAIGAFRLATFWVWLPAGWVALALANRRIARQPDASESADAHPQA